MIWNLRRYLFVPVLALHALAAQGQRITAVVNAAVEDPPNVNYPSVIINGDFTIFSIEASTPVVGDGMDESYTWTFDFTADPSYPSYPLSRPLGSALFTLTLRPTNIAINTDLFHIEGLPDIMDSQIRTLPINTQQTVQIQLLDYYTSEQITSILTANSGTLPMRYGDDAFMSSASLSFSPVPAPGALVTMLIGAIPGMLLLRRHRKPL